MCIHIRVGENHIPTIYIYSYLNYFKTHAVFNIQYTAETLILVYILLS